MTLIQDLDQMVIMFFICIPMDHDIISNYIGSRVDVMKVDVHVILEKVLSLVQSEGHLYEAISAPWSVKCSQ